jgi:Flp pilus assembly secretin CpaC
MRRLSLTAIAALLALTEGTALAGPLDVPLQSATIVGVGRHLIVPVPSGARVVSAGDSRLATVQSLSDTELLIAGVARGQTTVRLRDAEGTETDYQILVDTALATSPDTNAQVISVGIGHQKGFALSDVKRIAVGDPKVADAMLVGGREILVTGIASGRTSLIIWRTNDTRVSYVLKVEEKPLEESASEIRQLLGPMEGIRLRFIGDHIYLDGDVETKEDLDLVKRVCGLYQPVLVCL